MIFTWESNVFCNVFFSRGQYLDDVVDTELTNVRVGSAGPLDRGLGRAVLVEQCRCPMGYTGISCQVGIHYSLALLDKIGR